jgi:hypothetical protein
MMHGPGKLYFKNGKIIETTWEENFKHGPGFIVEPVTGRRH